MCNGPVTREHIKIKFSAETRSYLYVCEEGRKAPVAVSLHSGDHISGHSFDVEILHVLHASWRTYVRIVVDARE